ncbi:hypothetical protein HMPREF9445_02489 [Bacteroides clarus YIT 12056]|uniref:Toxin-antitoxin system, toxin component domain protein n=1 Tax=Bacteroides clarus YIT 12056 TaxID=762984 RepID=A0ABP2KRR2_9BACE|nr:hypothetical protein HMPREF9445_02489 [Bacteroides clarus YIT 12056]
MRNFQSVNLWIIKLIYIPASRKGAGGGLYTSTRTLLCVFPCIFTAVEEMEILCKSRFCVYAYFKG